MQDDNKLEEMLLQRDIPAPSSNLAYRISQVAQERAGQESSVIGSSSFIDEMMRLFVVPKPAYVTAFCLVFGLAVGLYAGVEDAGTQEWFSFLEAQEGEWL